MPETRFMALLVALIVAAAVVVAVYVYASVYANAGPRVRRWMRLGLAPRRAAAPLAAFRTTLRRRAERLRARSPLPGSLPAFISERHGDDMVSFARGPGGGAWTVVSRERIQAQQRARWEAREVAANGGEPLLELAAFNIDPGGAAARLSDRAVEAERNRKLQAVVSGSPEVRALVVADAINRHAPGWAAETGPSGGPGLYAADGPAQREPEEHLGAGADWSPMAEVGPDKKAPTLTHTKLDTEAGAILAAFEEHVQGCWTAPEWLTAYGSEVDAAFHAAGLDGLATAHARWRQTAFDVPSGEYRRVMQAA